MTMGTSTSTPFSAAFPVPRTMRRARAHILDGGDDLATGDERPRLAVRVRLQERHGEPRLQRVHALRQREGQVLAGSRQAVRPLEHRAHEHRLVHGRGSFAVPNCAGIRGGAGGERASRGNAARGGAGNGRERDACAERVGCGESGHRRGSSCDEGGRREPQAQRVRRCYTPTSRGTLVSPSANQRRRLSDLSWVRSPGARTPRVALTPSPPVMSAVVPVGLPARIAAPRAARRRAHHVARAVAPSAAALSPPRPRASSRSIAGPPPRVALPPPRSARSPRSSPRPRRCSRWRTDSRAASSSSTSGRCWRSSGSRGSSSCARC